MTRFYWVDTQEIAQADAEEKGYAEGQWIFCATAAELKAVKIANYGGIYMRTGMRELEQEFARIMRRHRPSW